MAKNIPVSQETARRVLSLLDMFGTPEHAAHQIRVQLTAISPYTDRGSERALLLLERIARFPDQPKALGQLRTIAGNIH